MLSAYLMGKMTILAVLLCLGLVQGGYISSHRPRRAESPHSLANLLYRQPTQHYNQIYGAPHRTEYEVRVVPAPLVKTYHYSTPEQSSYHQEATQYQNFHGLYPNVQNLPLADSGASQGFAQSSEYESGVSGVNQGFVQSTGGVSGAELGVKSFGNEESFPVHLGGSVTESNVHNYEFSTVSPPVDSSSYVQSANYENNLHNIAGVQLEQSGNSGYNVGAVKAVTSGGSINDAFGVQHDEINQEKVEKNFYFYAAPEDEVAVQPRISFEPQKKKKVNVIFIKAPSGPKLAPIRVSPPQVEQDKTVVYVLVKKPDTNQEVLVNAAPVSKPPRPEVYFVKYKNEAEAHEAINQVKGEEESDVNVSDLNVQVNQNQVEDNKPVQFINPPVNVNVGGLNDVNYGNQGLLSGGFSLDDESGKNFVSSTLSPLSGSTVQSFDENASKTVQIGGLNQLNYNSKPFVSGGFSLDEQNSGQTFVSSTLSPLSGSNVQSDENASKSVNIGGLSQFNFNSKPFVSGGFSLNAENSGKTFVSSTISPLSESGSSSVDNVDDLNQYLPPNN